MSTLLERVISERFDIPVGTTIENAHRTGKPTPDRPREVTKLNAATNEVRKSKRNFEHKLAQNIKSDSKSFYAYVRSKQNVRDRVGPLEDNSGNKITQ